LLAEAKATPSGFKSLSITDANRVEGLHAELEQAKKDMHAALSNSFDTPQAMRIILELIKDVNIHLKERTTDADLSTVEVIARWITKIVGIFGLDENASPPYDGLGWASAKVAGDLDPTTVVQPYSAIFSSVKSDVQALQLSSDSVSSLLAQQDPQTEFTSVAETGVRDVEQLAMPYLRSVSRLRDELRRVVSSESSETKKAILSLTDRIRDVDFTNLGVYLDDRPDGQASLIKFVPAAELIAAREEKKAKEAEKARLKEEAKRAKEVAEREKWEKAKVSPMEMFKDERFSEWDAEGLPTKVKDGGDIPKSQLKRFQKEQAKQRKAHEEWLVKFGGGGSS
jgi:cysteinyl-tRNA synthetase